MSLQLTTTLPNGVTLPTAYAKILTFSGNKTNTTIMVAFYADATAKTADKPAVSTQQYSFKTNDAIPVLTAGYAYLHTLPQFAGAVDV